MAVHKHCYTSLDLTNKVAAPGGIHIKRIRTPFSASKAVAIFLR